MKVTLELWIEIGAVGANMGSPVMSRTVDLMGVPFKGLIINGTTDDLDFVVEEVSYNLITGECSAWYTDKGIKPELTKPVADFNTTATDDQIGERVAWWQRMGWVLREQ